MRSGTVSRLVSSRSSSRRSSATDRMTGSIAAQGPVRGALSVASVYYGRETLSVGSGGVLAGGMRLCVACSYA
jgi:hypothetical protein